VFRSREVISEPVDDPMAFAAEGLGIHVSGRSEVAHHARFYRATPRTLAPVPYSRSTVTVTGDSTLTVTGEPAAI
jgi:hypothetical protein